MKERERFAMIKGAKACAEYIMIVNNAEYLKRDTLRSYIYIYI